MFQSSVIISDFDNNLWDSDLDKFSEEEALSLAHMLEDRYLVDFNFVHTYKNKYTKTYKRRVERANREAERV